MSDDGMQQPEDGDTPAELRSRVAAERTHTTSLPPADPAMAELLNDTPHYRGRRDEAWAHDLDVQAADFAKRAKDAKTLLDANRSPQR